MPKPPQTYRETQRPTQIAKQVDAAKALKQKVDAEQLQRTAFDALLKRAKLDLKRLDQARKIAESCKNFGKEPPTHQARLRKALAEIVDQLNDFAELQGKVKEFSSTLGTPAKTFVSQSKHVAGGDAAAVTHAAMAVIVFALVIQKAYAKLTGGR